ncbi:CDP-glycerol glycerophosphotransferase family protein, partial [Furfurilactobacillus siliginis]
MTDKLKSYIKTKIKLKDFIKLVIALVQFPVVLCAFIASKFDRTIPSKVWLIGEEGPDAKDNAFMFFQYLREQHADIPTAYYLTKDSPVFETVTKYGEVVEHSSFRHMKMMFKARYVLSTHDGHFAPWKQMNWREFKILYSWLNPKLEFVFLQHGVTKDNVEKNAGFARTRFDFFVTTTKDEYKAISDPELGYRNGQVIETGFSRFDNLYKRINEPTKNYILIMPTWRYYLSEASENDFASSDYFKNYMALLSNKELIQFLNG